MTEPSSEDPDVAEWLGHVKALAVGIGPRGPTRDGERRGAKYAKSSFSRAGLQPIWETFRGARSGFHPHLLGSFIMLAAFAVFPLRGAVTEGIAVLLTVAVIVSVLQELGFRGNLLRALVPKAESQNVSAIIPPKSEHTRDLVLVGHVDTQRTPLVFRTPAWVKVFDKFTMVSFVAYLWQAIDFALAMIFNWPWAWLASVPSAVCAALPSCHVHPGRVHAVHGRRERQRERSRLGADVGASACEAPSRANSRVRRGYRLRGSPALRNDRLLPAPPVRIGEASSACFRADGMRRPFLVGKGGNHRAVPLRSAAQASGRTVGCRAPRVERLCIKCQRWQH